MTAAQLVGPERFDLVRVDKPGPGPGQVRVAVEGCGVCASNLPAWSGRPWFHYPFAPGELGHEGWGRVDATGEGVSSALLGRRVAMISNHAYAEAEVVHANDLIMLPEDVDIAPLEPFGCVFNIIERAAIADADTVAVVGLGFIGLGVARLAVAAGARVLAISTNPSSLGAARMAGAAHTLTLDGRHETACRVAEITAGSGCDRVIECTGYQEPLDLCGDIVAEHGHLIIAGFHQDGPRQVDLQQWNWKGIDVINAHERDPARIRRGMQAAADAIGRDRSWVETLITDRLPLADIGIALDRATRRPPGFVKAVVMARTP